MTRPQYLTALAIAVAGLAGILWLQQRTEKPVGKTMTHSSSQRPLPEAKGNAAPLILDSTSSVRTPGLQIYGGNKLAIASVKIQGKPICGIDENYKFFIARDDYLSECISILTGREVDAHFLPAAPPAKPKKAHKHIDPCKVTGSVCTWIGGEFVPLNNHCTIVPVDGKPLPQAGDLTDEGR